MTYRAPLGHGQRRYRKTRITVALDHQTAEQVRAIAETLDTSLSDAAAALISRALATPRPRR